MLCQAFLCYITLPYFMSCIGQLASIPADTRRNNNVFIEATYRDQQCTFW